MASVHAYHWISTQRNAHIVSAPNGIPNGIPMQITKILTRCAACAADVALDVALDAWDGVSMEAVSK